MLAARTALKSGELENLHGWIEGLGNVAHGPHRFGGVEFSVGGFEFMHSHGRTHLDIRLSKEDQAKVLGLGKAERHLFAPEAGWVTFRIRSSEDIEKAKEIITLAYSNASFIISQHQARRDGSR